MYEYSISFSLPWQSYMWDIHHQPLNSLIWWNMTGAYITLFIPSWATTRQTYNFGSELKRLLTWTGTKWFRQAKSHPPKIRPSEFIAKNPRELRYMSIPSISFSLTLQSYNWDIQTVVTALLLIAAVIFLVKHARRFQRALYSVSSYKKI